MKSLSATELAIRYGFLVLMAGLIIVFSVLKPAFLSPQSGVFILQSVAITGILALGVTATLVVDSEHRLANAGDTTARLLLLVLSPLA